MARFTATRHIDSVSASPAGDRLALGLSALDGNVWDGGVTLLSNDGQEICTRALLTGVPMVRFSGPRVVVAARDDGDVAVYSSDDLKELHLLSAHDDIVSCVADNPHDESHIATCGWDGCVHLWDYASSPQKPLQSYLLAHNGHVNDVAFFPADANLFVSVGQDGFLRVWDRREASTSTCACIVELGQVGACVAALPGHDRSLVVGTDAGHVCLVDVRAAATTVFHAAPSSSSAAPVAAGVVARAALHKGRVRRVLPLPLGPGAGSDALFVTASDDTTCAVSSADVDAMQAQGTAGLCEALKRCDANSLRMPPTFICPMDRPAPAHPVPLHLSPPGTPSTRTTSRTLRWPLLGPPACSCTRRRRTRPCTVTKLRRTISPPHKSVPYCGMGVHCFAINVFF